MAVSFFGEIIFTMPKKDMRKLGFWFEQFAKDIFLTEEKNGFYRLTCSERHTREYALLEDIGTFINAHGEAVDGEVNCTTDCETYMESYNVFDKKIVRVPYHYDEISKKRTTVLEIYENFEEVVNSNTQTNVDESLVSRVFEEWGDLKEMEEVFTEILEFVGRTEGLLEIFVDGSKILFIPEGLFLIDCVPGEPVPLGEILADVRRVDNFLTEMPFSDIDHEHARIRKDEFYLPFIETYRFNNLELKTPDKTWVSACSLCTKRLISVVEDGCRICKIDFIDEELSTYFSPVATH